jgi:hypothetical protein
VKGIGRLIYDVLGVEYGTKVASYNSMLAIVTLGEYDSIGVCWNNINFGDGGEDNSENSGDVEWSHTYCVLLHLPTQYAAAILRYPGGTQVCIDPRVVTR